MGFLGKHNRRATRRGAAAWAAAGGIVGTLLGMFTWRRLDMPFAAVFFVVPFMAAWCALAGWAMEWQVPVEPDDDDKHGAASPGDG